jgi:hypothetical protein
MSGRDRLNGLVNLSLAVLDFLSFIQDDIKPTAFISYLEYFYLRPQKFIGGYDDSIVFESLIN